ncbi:MAG: beta strand repeat-containing protein, partial [Mesonia sp.]
MKNFIFLFLSLAFMSLSVHAQTPEKFNYQGIARNSQGEPMATQNLGLKISIINGSTTIYSETHQVTTNNFGLYTLAIGDGTPVSGAMASVGWSTTKLLKVEIDPNGGTNYTDLGTTELLSVPYAMYAVTSGDNGSPTGAAGGDLTGSYPNPDIADDAVNTAQLSNNAVKTVKIYDGAVTSPKLDDMGATSGQFLKFDGTNWVPDNVTGGGSADDWGAQVIENTNRLSGDGTAANPLDIAQQGASSGQVLKWNGTTWVPADDETGTGGGTADDWGAQVAATDATIDGDGTTAAPLGLADAAVTGEKINQMSAANGQILKWNGTTWEPADDETATGGSGDDWGAQIAETDATLNGEGTTANPLGVADDAIATVKLQDAAVTGGKINQMSATDGQILKWNNTTTTWEPADDETATSGSGDDWGAQVIENTDRLSGDGTAASPLDIAQQGATDGQILKWNNTTMIWEPADDETATGGSGDDWGAQVAETDATLAGDGTSGNELGLSQNGATDGQILKWNNINTTWEPADESAGNAGWALDGSAVGANDFVGTTNDEALRFKVNNVEAGFINTFGGTSPPNTAFGIQTLQTLTTGSANAAFGSQVLVNTHAGSRNTAMGNTTMYANTSGSYNTAIGQVALRFNTSGDDNTAIGSYALHDNTFGSENSAMGRLALTQNTIGEHNTANGYSALSTNISGSFNVGVGYNAEVSTDNLTNATAIGANALVSQDNSLVLGSINGLNGATADTKVGIGTTSPDVQLDISGGQWDLTNTEGDLRIGNDTHRLKMSISTGGAGAGNGRIRAVGGTDKLLLGAGTEDVLSVGGNGHVGINNENPDEELVIGDNLGIGFANPAATFGDATGGGIAVGNPTTYITVGSGSTFNRARIIASDANGFGEGNIEMRTRQLSVGIDAGVDAVNPYPLRVIQSGVFGMYLENAIDATSNWEFYTSIGGNLQLYGGGNLVGNFDET